MNKEKISFFELCKFYRIIKKFMLCAIRKEWHYTKTEILSLKFDQWSGTLLAMDEIWLMGTKNGSLKMEAIDVRNMVENLKKFDGYSLHYLVIIKQEEDHLLVIILLPTRKMDVQEYLRKYY